MSSTHRPKEDQNAWNIFFSLVFGGIVVAALWWVWGRGGTFPHAIPLFDALLLSLAAFRITRLVVYDKIMRWFRELFVDAREYDKDGATWVELVPPRGGVRRTVHDLLGCPWCIGFWSALIVTCCYYLFAWAWVVILFLAIAAMGSLFQIIANLVGWTAENGKLDAHRKEREQEQ